MKLTAVRLVRAVIEMFHSLTAYTGGQIRPPPTAGLDAVTPAAAEQEQGWRERIHAGLFSNQCGKTIN